MFRLITLLFLSTSAWATDPVFTVGTESIIDIRNTGQALNLGDDNMSGMKSLGFDFDFYGSTFDEVNISMNGFFTFQNNFSVSRSRNYRSETLPATSFNYTVFPLWTDLINRNGTQNPYIQTFGNTSDTDQYFVVGWYNAKEYSNQLQNTFEAILYEGTNEIEFRYDKIQIKTHDITIGVQGNNEATTYLRYEDTGSTQYMQTNDWSLTTAVVVDESFTNLSSECLVDSSYSELCDVYDLSNDFDDQDFLYGVDEDIIFGYDEDEIYYGYDLEEDGFTYTSPIIFETTGSGNNDDHYDDTFLVFNDMEFIEEYDLEFIDEFELEDDTLFIHIDSEYDLEFTDSLPPIEEIEYIELPQTIEITEVIENIDDFEERMEENFLAFMEEYHDEDEHHEEEEIIEEELEEEFAEREESFDEEEALEDEEESLDDEIDEINPEEVDEEESKGATKRNIRETRNLVSNLVSSVVRGSYSSSNNISQTISNSSSGGGSSSSGFSGSVDVSGTTVGNINSPTVSNQVAASQVQTNTVLQSITVMPMPSVDNTPSVAMAEVQVTTMENQIESVTSTVMTASEADEVADAIVARNIQSQQQENQRTETESGEYNTQGQANLMAFMGYSTGFNAYQNMNIPDGSNWYEPRTIYANVILDDNIAGYYNLVGTNLDQQADLIGTQDMEFFR